MDGTASVHVHQHDNASRQAMMYLLTMGWFLARTSLAMTPEHSAINGENSSLDLQKQGTPRACASHHPKLQFDRAYTHACGKAGTDGSPAQLAADENPCKTSKSSANLQCSLGLPKRLGRYDLQDEKTSGAMCRASPLGQGNIEGPKAQHHGRAAAAFENIGSPDE